MWPPHWSLLSPGHGCSMNSGGTPGFMTLSCLTRELLISVHGHPIVGDNNDVFLQHKNSARLIYSENSATATCLSWRLDSSSTPPWLPTANNTRAHNFQTRCMDAPVIQNHPRNSQVIPKDAYKPQSGGVFREIGGTACTNYTKQKYVLWISSQRILKLRPCICSTTIVPNLDHSNIALMWRSLSIISRYALPRWLTPQ